VQTHTIQTEQVGIIPLPRVGGALSTRCGQYQGAVTSMSLVGGQQCIHACIVKTENAAGFATSHVCRMRDEVRLENPVTLLHKRIDAESLLRSATIGLSGDDNLAHGLRCWRLLTSSLKCSPRLKKITRSCTAK